MENYVWQYLKYIGRISTMNINKLEIKKIKIASRNGLLNKY